MPYVILLSFLIVACQAPTGPAPETAAPVYTESAPVADSIPLINGLLCDSHEPAACGLDSALWKGTPKEGYFVRK